MRPRADTPARLLRTAAAMAVWALSIGCFTARTHQPLAGGADPAAPAQVLPVLAGQVRISVVSSGGQVTAAQGSGADQEEAAETCNELLEDLLRPGAGAFLAPSRLGKTQGPTLSERVALYLNDPGPADESWKTEGFREVSKTVGVPFVVQLRLQIEQREPATPGQLNASWNGVVRAEARLIAAEQGRVVASSAGEGSFQGSAGAIVVPSPYPYPPSAVPYAFGKGFPPAVEAALRSAMTGLETSRGGRER